MKERGLYLVHTDAVPVGKFFLAVTDKDIEEGQEYSFDGNSIVFASTDSSLADRLIVEGISRRENLKGNNTLLLLNPKDEVKFYE